MWITLSLSHLECFELGCVASCFLLTRGQTVDDSFFSFTSCLLRASGSARGDHSGPSQVSPGHPHSLRHAHGLHDSLGDISLPWLPSHFPLCLFAPTLIHHLRQQLLNRLPITIPARPPSVAPRSGFRLLSLWALPLEGHLSS